jgi:hypothetical protein
LSIYIDGTFIITGNLTEFLLNNLLNKNNTLVLKDIFEIIIKISFIIYFFNYLFNYNKNFYIKWGW